MLDKMQIRIDRIEYSVVYFQHYRSIKNHTFGHRGVQMIIKKYIMASRCIGPIPILQ